MRTRTGSSLTPEQRYAFGVALILLLALILTSVETLIGRIIGLTIGFTIHEWAHAYTALRLGDRTADFQGRVTLDPRAHLEPMGMVLALLAGFGWARPVPVNTRAFYPKERQGLMLVALAGPVSNLIIATFFAIIFRIAIQAIPIGSGYLDLSIWDGSVANFFYNILLTIIIFNLGLLFFNLIPLHPLDGWKIMLGIIPPENAYEISRYQDQSTRILIFILAFGIISPQLNLIRIVLLPFIEQTYFFLTGL